MLKGSGFILVSAMVAATAAVLTAGVAGGGADQGRAGGSATPAAQKRSTEWTLDALLPSLVDLGPGRTFEKGQALFKQAACGGCHAFASESKGGGFAPDLTAVAAKFTRDAILRAILEPSAEMSPNFQQTTFTLKDGRVILGTVVEETDARIVLAPALLALPATIEIKVAEVVSQETSEVSAMPAGLLSPFTKDEILELLAFLESAGDRTAPVFKKKIP